MGRFNPKSFAQPDLLKGIEPFNLIRILEPCRAFLETRGLSLPREDGSEIDYLKLSGILAQPDEWMDSHVIEGLHVIGNLGTDENFDDLLDIARRNFIDVNLEATAADLAARIWLEMPQALEVKDREAGSRCRRKFESFRARDPENVLPVEQLPTQFDALEADLEGWFLARKRGVGCRVIRVDLPGEVRFLVQHGDPFKRQPSRKGAQSTCTYFRPERTDLVVYDFVNNELRISTRTLGELRLYREKFGKHLFGDPEKFVYAQKYTLLPLKKLGAAALYCRDVGGMERVCLKEIEYAWPDTIAHTEKHKSEDVFKTLARLKRRIELDADILHAVFSVKLVGEKTARPVSIKPPNIAEYGRGEDAAIIEEWFRAREFVRVGSVDGDEEADTFMAVA